MPSTVSTLSLISASMVLRRLPTCAWMVPLLSATEYTRHSCPSMSVVL